MTSPWRACHRRLVGRRLADAGNAIVEFVYLAILLLVPLVYVLLTVFRVQGASYAVASAAREAGRVFVTSPAEDGAADSAYTAAAIVMRDAGLRLDRRGVEFSCSAEPCLTPGETVHVLISYDVGLPLVPRIFDGRAPATVHVSSDHLEVVDRFRLAPR